VADPSAASFSGQENGWKEARQEFEQTADRARLAGTREIEAEPAKTDHRVSLTPNLRHTKLRSR